jgi:CubicO group peptidase (beta-lactamase class C family)
MTAYIAAILSAEARCLPRLANPDLRVQYGSAMPEHSYRTAAELGLMSGAPPFAVERQVTLDNWQDPPFNRWGFQHVRDLIPTAPIRRGEGPTWSLPRAERDLSGVRLPFGGRRSVDLETFLTETYSDGFLVLHRGHVITELYLNGMAADTTHLLMSVSKSITSAVCGSLVSAGLLSPGDLVTSHIPELDGTSWSRCTVRHLLDMRAGTRFNEDYASLEADVRVYEQIYQWRPRKNPDLPGDITAYFPTLVNQGSHGGPFDYRSVLTDMLAWVMERAAGGRFADLVSKHLWQPMGAEFDAEVTVDAHGNAMADGGVCTTLRDLGRFGQLLADDGGRGSTEVIPAAWIRDTLTPDPDSVAAYAAEDSEPQRLGSYYRNQFWVYDPGAPIYRGSGINGQAVLVHGPAHVVIAKLSTWPVAWEEGIAARTLDAMLALAEEIAG